MNKTAARKARKDSCNLEDVKQAVREVMDEKRVAYSSGVGAFADGITNSLLQMMDHLDDFFTTNLVEDDPRAALPYIDVRIRTARKVEKHLKSNIEKLQKMRAKVAQAAKTAG